jgi:L-ribulose-5-phosphate 4-epimerase
MDYESERQILTEALKDMNKKGLVYGKAGNLSIRTNDNNVLIKPSGGSYEKLSEVDLALVDLDGKRLSGKYPPSSETPMHTMIYRHFENVKAIVHSHSENSLVCAITVKVIPIFCNEGIGFGGPIPVSEFAIPGTCEIGKNAVKALEGPPQVKGIIISNHGALTVGGSMAEACSRAEMLEKLASIYCRALAIGPVSSFSQERVREIIDHYSKKKQEE